jgi:phospholipase D1/2
MRGDRDSELASVIRDTDMIDSTMAGKPYKVGRFAHTLRVRLMREHLGCDVDEMEEDDLLDRDAIVPEDDIQVWDPSSEQQGKGEHKDEGLVKTQTVGDRMWMHAASVAHSGTSQAYSSRQSLADVSFFVALQLHTVKPSR